MAGTLSAATAGATTAQQIVFVAHVAVRVTKLVCAQLAISFLGRVDMSEAELSEHADEYADRMFCAGFSGAPAPVITKFDKVMFKINFGRWPQQAMGKCALIYMINRHLDEVVNKFRHEVSAGVGTG